MAIYHCSVSNVSRGKGSNACATLSYITGCRVRCSRTGETFSYGRSERVAETCIELPPSAPQRYHNPAILFDELESFEKSSNARVAKKVVVALPRELGIDEWRDMLSDYVQPLIEGGWPCVYAIHTDADGHNPHAHILIANRQLDENGEWKKAKTKKVYALDADGNRIPQLDENGEQKLGKRNERLWKRETISANPLDQRETLVEMRESWASVCNARLEPPAKIDHRSHAERELETIPTIHEGYAARAIEQRGGVSRRCETNRHIRTINDYIRNLVAKIAEYMRKAKELTTPTPTADFETVCALEAKEHAREIAAELALADKDKCSVPEDYFSGPIGEPGRQAYIWRMPRFAQAPNGEDMDGMSTFVPVEVVFPSTEKGMVEVPADMYFNFQRCFEKKENGEWQQIPVERLEPPVPMKVADAVKTYHRALMDEEAYRQVCIYRSRMGLPPLEEPTRAAEKDYEQQTGTHAHHYPENRHRGR